MLECKIYVCKLWEKKLLELSWETPDNVKFSPEPEKAMIRDFRKKRLGTVRGRNYSWERLDKDRQISWDVQESCAFFFFKET